MNRPTIYEERAGYHCLTRINRHTTDLYLFSCGTQKCPPGHYFGPGSRPDYHLHFILDGEGYYHVNQQKYHLKRGQLFVCPANTTVYYYADVLSPWYYSWVSFNGAKAVDYLKRADFDNQHLIRNSNIPPERFTALIQEMLKANQLTTANELKRIGYLYQLITLLMDSNNASVNQIYNHYDYSSDTYIEHARQYIAVNYNSSIHISDVAAYIGINRSYLCNVFKEKLNMSPQEYLIHFRMNKAKELLSATAYDVKSIAGQVGYKDALAFSKAFKRTVGLAPTEYRYSLPPDVAMPSMNCF